MSGKYKVGDTVYCIDWYHYHICKIGKHVIAKVENGMEDTYRLEDNRLIRGMYLEDNEDAIVGMYNGIFMDRIRDFQSKYKVGDKVYFLPGQTGDPILEGAITRVPSKRLGESYCYECEVDGEKFLFGMESRFYVCESREEADRMIELKNQFGWG